MLERLGALRNLIENRREPEIVKLDVKVAKINYSPLIYSKERDGGD